MHYRSFASLDLLQETVQMRTKGLREKLLKVERLSFVLLHLLGTLWQILDPYLDFHFTQLMLRPCEQLLENRLLFVTQKRSFELLIDFLINRL